MVGFPSLVGLKLRHTHWLLRSHGLQPRHIKLDNGATIHCWLPNNNHGHGHAAAPGVRPVLVLLHGFGSSGALAWEREVGTLSKHFRLYIPDLLFFGGSHIQLQSNNKDLNQDQKQDLDLNQNQNQNQNQDQKQDLDLNLNQNQNQDLNLNQKKTKTKKKKKKRHDDEYGGKLVHHDDNHDETHDDGHDDDDDEDRGLTEARQVYGVGNSTEDRRSEIFQAHCIYEALQKCGIFGGAGTEEEEQEGILVCGHSYGGFVAYRLAHLYGPSIVRKVVIISSGIMMDHHSNDPLLRASGYGTIHELLVPDSPAHLKTSLKFSLDYLPPFLPNFIFKDMFQAFFGDWRREKLELVDAIILGKENSPPLPKIEQDVLIVWGEEDQIFNISLAYKLKDFLGDNAQLATMKGVGHIPTIFKAKELNQLIISFLTK